MPKKNDAQAIRQFLQDFAQENRIKATERRWWPRFLFHYTDIHNAVQVLEDGFLYSRLQAESMGKMTLSSGSPRVLSGTDYSIKDFVRENRNFILEKPFDYTITLPQITHNYQIKVALDSHLIYANSYEETDSPF